jgi:hypothetical protein
MQDFGAAEQGLLLLVRTTAQEETLKRDSVDKISHELVNLCMNRMYSINCGKIL